MTTPIEQFYQKECEKIDPRSVNAFTELKFENNLLTLSTSWGEDKIDTTEMVNDSETKTELEISSGNLIYVGEGETFTITGDNLAGIVSMTKLKDVSGTIADGYIYMYNGATQKFVPYDLQTTIQNIIGRLPE